MRGFEYARKWVGEGHERCPYLNEMDEFEKQFPSARLPEYATKHSAGADFFCAEEVVIPSIWSGVANILASTAKGTIHNWISDSPNDCTNTNSSLLKPTLVHTGIKACMEDDEALMLYNRSGNPKKLGLVLANGVGVVDADYYNNPDNDGEIMFAFYNFMPWSVTLKVGDKLGQGVFQKFLRPTTGLNVKEEERVGGFGSTGK